MTGHCGQRVPGTTFCAVGLGFDDFVVLPVVLLALAAKKLLQASFSILIHILDYAFPILLQLMRFPLFTARIMGDAFIALLVRFIRYLPLSITARHALRELVKRHWSWIRQKLSYTAFEDALHRVFEAGMQWIFLTCKGLTPGSALLVIVGAVLWLPVSLIAATAMHAALIVQAAALPAWMQLLHPLATVIAKSKLLVLPTYPAAWPQAKRHRLVQTLFEFKSYVAGLRLFQKMGYRFDQAEHASAVATDCLKSAAFALGLTRSVKASITWVTCSATRIANASQRVILRRVEELSEVPVVGSIVAIYAMRYNSTDQQTNLVRPSQKIRELFERWSIKFSQEHYEKKEQTGGPAQYSSLGSRLSSGV